ncbi:MAG: hypothetical protein AB7G20_07630 [Sulfurimonas sp.]|uniref:hypothetical protein n=1 Tax=Sulfurimonas sp. TaxID=2022749 RepID=UPI003D0BEFDC
MTKFNNREARKILVSFIGSEVLTIRGILTLVAIVLTFSWFPDGLGALVKSIFSEETQMYFQIGIPALILVGVYFYLYFNKDNLITPMDMHVDDAKEAKVLILFLSSNRAVQDALKVSSIEELGINNFRMPITAINYHKNKLKKVVVVCSKDSESNFDDFIACVKNILKDFDTSKILKHTSIINFEDAEQVYKLLENQYSKLKEEKIREKEIIIDVTGGQKIISIASCIFALPNDREIQYVSTTDYKVKSYDIRYDRENG